MAQKSNEGWWFPFLYLAFIVIVELVLFGISIGNPNKTAALDFYLSFRMMGMSIITILIFLIVKALTEKLVDDGVGFPIGQTDESFLIMNLFGWKKAFILSAVGAIAFGFAFYHIASSTGSSIFPTYGMSIYTTSYSALPGVDSRTVLQVGAGAVRGVMDASAATVNENPVLLLLPLGIIWPISKYLMMKLFPPTKAKIAGSSAANWITLVTSVLLVAWIFPGFYHFMAYQGITPAYQYNQKFVVLALGATALTGFPFILDAAHFGNNFAVSTRGLFSVGMYSASMLFGFALQAYLERRKTSETIYKERGEKA